MASKKIIFATCIGTLLEWAEFTFFAYMADQLSSLFFSSQDLYLARLKTYAIFATSYLMRPIGAVLFGYIGDRHGRKPAIIGALLLMALATFGIGSLPTYNTIGIAAPILLVLFRMLQGIAVAGEFNGAAVLLTEQNQQYPFLAGSWTACAAACGMAVGGIAATILTAGSMPIWCWRVPFLLSSIIALIAMYLRGTMQETNIFKLAKKDNQLFDSPVYAAWKYNKEGLLCTAAFAIFISVFVYTGNIYYKTMAVNIGKLNPHTAATIITCGILLTTILIPIAAILADKTNGYKICLSGILLAIIFSPIIMGCAQSGNIILTLIGQIIYAIIDAMVSATMFTILLNKFQTGTKYSGSSIAWSVTTAIFGGSTLLVNELLIGHFKLLNGPGLYISISALICISIVLPTTSRQNYVIEQHK
ncbi:MAG: MFS transporter [Gammaproteobacteria bacterium]|jgi:MHS family proline/betaine transporter-like MFS transporter